MLHCAHPNVFVEADMYSQRGTLSIDLVNKTNLGVCVCVWYYNEYQNFTKIKGCPS